MSTQSKPLDLGFGADFDDLSGVTPRKAKKPKQSKPAKSRTKSKTAARTPDKSVSSRTTDDVARRFGFESRENKPVLRKRRRRHHHTEPLDQVSIRGPVRVLNNFIIYCEDNDLSYWEALEQLVPVQNS